MKCSRCGSGLRPVSDVPMRRGGDWTVQYWDALAIEFIGGFGMYIDPLASQQSQRDLTVVLCRTCAAQFLDENEWARPIVERKLDKIAIDS
jgi:hypothetical protein